MTAPRDPRSKLYDGAIYGRLVEPLLDGVHGFVADHLPPGQRLLEACCGTGGLARRLANSGRDVVGVDLSPRNIDYARRKNDGTSGGKLRFDVADVSQLVPPDEGPYDLATVVLALHEMPSSTRGPVLQALLRVARRVMVVDFATPMPWNVSGVRNRAMEIAAGFEHFSTFRDFNRQGGLPQLFDRIGAEIESERRLDAKTLHVAVLQTMVGA